MVRTITLDGLQIHRLEAARRPTPEGEEWEVEVVFSLLGGSQVASTLREKVELSPGDLSALEALAGSLGASLAARHL